MEAITIHKCQGSTYAKVADCLEQSVEREKRSVRKDCDCDGRLHRGSQTKAEQHHYTIFERKGNSFINEGSANNQPTDTN